MAINRLRPVTVPRRIRGRFQYETKRNRATKQIAPRLIGVL